MNSNVTLLEVKNLHVSIDDNEILKDFNLKINQGEIHAIMGPNGSGKSTFSKVLAGHPAYSVLDGEILFKGLSILDLEPEERSHLGIFLAFQYPIEIPGVSNEDFLRLAYNSKQKFYNKPEVDPIEFFGLINEKLELVNMSPVFLSRNVNEGFSGGEKKRNEILQMILLDSELAILDETDSGLDIDALKTISIGINKFMNPSKGILLITHYQRLLDYVKPTYVHVMQNGKIIKTGSAELAKELEDKGYEWLKKHMIDSDRGKARMEKVYKFIPIAEELGTNLTKLAIAWCLLNDNVSTVILGASKPEQLKENIESLEVIPLLTEEVQKKLSSI